ncbi:hypothetical protein Tco_0324204 [Tanacetum coccineum]
MASMNTRLNIKKLVENIVQKHGGSKQGAQGDREAEVFQVSNDDTTVAQRRLEDKQPEEKTNTDCLVKEQEKEYQTGWKIKTGNVLDSCNQRSTQQCMKSGVAKHLGVAGKQQNGLVDETNMTLFAKLSCLLKEQLLEPALNLDVHCCGLEFRVLNGYDQKSFDEERGLN